MIYNAINTVVVMRWSPAWIVHPTSIKQQTLTLSEITEVITEVSLYLVIRAV